MTPGALAPGTKTRACWDKRRPAHKDNRKKRRKKHTNQALKAYKPLRLATRLRLDDRSELWKGRPVKSLTEGLSKKGGRNNTGRITQRRRGGGAKRLYRIVDFKRNKHDMSKPSWCGSNTIPTGPPSSR